MQHALKQLLSEIEKYGIENDAVPANRAHRMLNITHATGEFLSVMVRATHAKHVLEIGTSNGYSTLWLAHAVASVNGHVDTIEASDAKVAMAAHNFARAGFASSINQHHGDAGQVLRGMSTAVFDLIFLDSARTQYVAWWPDIKRILRRGGLLIVDNATSHPEQMQAFVELVCADAEFTTCLVPVGKGEFMATRTMER
jgi:predicted O-methyltransferase YrrM